MGWHESERYRTARAQGTLRSRALNYEAAELLSGTHQVIATLILPVGAESDYPADLSRIPIGGTVTMRVASTIFGLC
jgi:hypothetical protein